MDQASGGNHCRIPFAGEPPTVPEDLAFQSPLRFVRFRVRRAEVVWVDHAGVARGSKPLAGLDEIPLRRIRTGERKRDRVCLPADSFLSGKFSRTVVTWVLPFRSVWPTGH